MESGITKQQMLPFRARLRLFSTIKKYGGLWLALRVLLLGQYAIVDEETAGLWLK